MSKKVSQKKLKFEFEFSVEMEELGEEHLCNCESTAGLEELQRLQKALLENKTALLEQMMAKAIGKLQEYIDSLASQDNLSSLEAVAGTLDTYDQDFFQDAPDEFADLTRPLRSAALAVHVEHSALQEQVEDEDGSQAWQPVWADLFYETELGKDLQGFSVPQPFVPVDTGKKLGHYLLARHLTRQPDGIHFEARCTCGMLFTAVAEDEAGALQAAWADFKRHHDNNHLGQKMRRGWTEIQRKKYGEC